MTDQEDQDLNTGLAEPARRALAGAGIKSSEDLARFTKSEASRLHGIGQNALKI